MKKVTDNHNCPYCLSSIDTDEKQIRCPKCGVIHHADCWKANGSCSVYGCDGWAVWTNQINNKVAPDTVSNVDLTKASNSMSKKNEVVRCIDCGEEVRPGQVTCWNCRRKNAGNYYFDNCAGQCFLFLFGVISLITLLVKTLT